MAPKNAPSPKADKRLSDDKTIPWSVGIKESEAAELAELAKQAGISKNALGVFLIRHGLIELRAKRLKIPVRRITVVDMPE